MPPLAGPRLTLCWTRWPVNTWTLPSSIVTGKFTVSSRCGTRNTRRIPSSRSSFSAAWSNWDWATAQMFGASATGLWLAIGCAECLLLQARRRLYAPRGPKAEAGRLAMTVAILAQVRSRSPVRTWRSRTTRGPAVEAGYDHTHDDLRRARGRATGPVGARCGDGRA